MRKTICEEMKVLFVIHDLGFADHIAIAYLSAIAKQLNHQTFFCALDRNDLGAKIDEITPDVVAYSVNILGYRKTIEAHKKVAKTHDFISIMGGPHPTVSPETFPESGMDAYCIGEGEYAFRDFLIKIEKGQSFDNVENLITKKGRNSVRPLIKNLDELPPADRDLILSNSYLKNTPKKTFYATRGCPFECAYCCNNYYHKLYQGKGTFVRRFSVERLIQEIEDVKKKYLMNFVKFGDDLFAMRADEWLEEFSVKYAERVGIPFNCFLRVDRISNRLLKLLKDAGCFSVHLSVDSTSDYVREGILNRRMKRVDIAGNLRKIRSYGINTWVNYMLAVPGSSVQDDLDTLVLNKQGRVTYPHYSTTDPMRGTALFDYCVKYGFVDASYEGDMSMCDGRSELSCFSDREKNIRYNILLLGALIAKLPFPFDRFATRAIKVIPPNIIFKKIYNLLFEYYIRHKIFILPKGG